MPLNNHIKWALRIGLLVLSACNHKQREQGEEEKMNLSSVKIINLDGTSFNWEPYRNKTVFINFWATWCKPCIREMPSIKKAMEILKGEDISFLFATNEDEEMVTEFNKQYQFDFHYVNVENLEELDITALPTTLIFGRNGKLRLSEIGYRPWDTKENLDQLRKIINQQ